MGQEPNCGFLSLIFLFHWCKSTESEAFRINKRPD